MLLFAYQFSPQCLLYDIELTEMLKMTNNEQCRIILEPVFYKQKRSSLCLLARPAFLTFVEDYEYINTFKRKDMLDHPGFSYNTFP